jgi:hypothetical protein
VRYLLIGAIVVMVVLPILGCLGLRLALSYLPIGDDLAMQKENFRGGQRGRGP